MVKLADTQDLGSCAERRAGSSPVTRTNQKQAVYRIYAGIQPVFLYTVFRYDSSSALKNAEKSHDSL